MKIGVLGTGDVGRTISVGLANIGHNVMIGTRDPGKPELVEWRGDSDISVGTFAEAAAFGDVLVLAVGWSSVEAVLDLAGQDNIAEKVVLDANNPLRFDAEGQPPVLDIPHNDSAGETIQRRLPDARIVKAFNTIGSPHMVNPDFPDGKPDMFICGNDDDAKQIANTLIEELGWRTSIDLGGIENSRYLESMAMVWIVHFFNTGFQGGHAFSLLRK
ncbi:MAG: NADPH-dependent F420 reductase [Pseudomonadota bacterium]